MKTMLSFFGLVLGASVHQVTAQGVGDGVVLTGGLGPATTYATPAQATTIYQQPVVYQQPAVYQQPVIYAVPAYTVLNGGYYNPNVIYFGGPNSGYRNYYPGCNYSPNVLYFGRGQSYYHGYNFTRFR